MNNFSDTIYFKTVFPTLDSYLSFVGTYTGIDVETENEIIASDYKYLYNKYCNSSIAYDTVEAFYRHLGIDYQDYYNQNKYRQSYAKKTYTITDTELEALQYSVNNMANSPQETLVNPLDTVINYVSAQTSNKISNNKLRAYLNAIDRATTMQLNKFIDIFKKHFITILIPQIYLYNED